ncbi:aspartyl-tRNA(Asn)/glutamyl-tRNA(Gln) amidotransferase subunit A [Dyadobacter jejuensis]|uniref:Glutamyl-tRNA(Gln) amidotransferase subunit A n=1 Tax=Dyadobacter jejuensis TaxID=1082580 RepID=A0A316AQY4_9BACT|nr:Asp-tRNA(Asn)/Glu-tRNA(Gln) amidotransferase subunit GatA [Dyadobacter jejuensis]PWJ59624.1 aspartyl-tRNA(Asn)/glutamyl-tRNA(Gln) amidotransferase subunit A [Dyadobacter jejuensis]
MKEYLRLTEIQKDLSVGVISCVELVNHYLDRIEAHSHLNAFVEVYQQEAKETALLVDAKIKAGTAGKLAGMVVGIKDVLSWKGHAVQAGSQILNSYIAPYTATAVQRLVDEDAIIIGRQNCDEFAMGSSNENSSFGPVLNAKDNNKVPGGSSGGSAVAVQAGLCHASLGTDTGGSVRQPAAFCGVVGLKPSYGRVSRWGLIAYASSFDCIGPITKSVEDAAILLEVMAGSDEFDSTASSAPVPAYSATLHTQKKYRIGYMQDMVDNPALDPAIRDNTLALLHRLKEEGHQVESVQMQTLKHLLPTYYILTTAEASSNLSRFDGVRYGHRSADAVDLESLYKKSRTEGFGAEVRRRILLGTFVLSANYYDAYYTKAQSVRRMVRDETEAFFKDYDFFISPVTPSTAFKIGEKTADPMQMFLADVFTVHANVVGFPAIAIPNGEDADGMPIGVQIMAPNLKEADMLAFANQLSKLAAGTLDV